MGRPRKNSGEADTDILPIRAKKGLIEDFAIFAEYDEAGPAEIVREMMRNRVKERMKDKRAMAFYDRKKGQKLITEVTTDEESLKTQLTP